MNSATKRAAFWMGGIVAAVALSSSFAVADQGTANFSIWNRSLVSRNPLFNRANSYETIVHLDAAQDITNFGTFSLWTDGLFSGGKVSLSRALVSWSGFKSGGMTFEARLGDDIFQNSNLESRFINLYHPYIYFRGGAASAASKSFDLLVFGGKIARLTGLLGSTYEIKDQPFYGIRGRMKFGTAIIVGGGIIHATKDVNDPLFSDPNTLILVDSEVAVAPGTILLGEFRKSLPVDASAAPGSSSSGQFGPLIRAGKWNFEANYRFTGSRFRDVTPETQFLRDEKGLFSSVRYQLSRNLTLFGIADRSNDNPDRVSSRNAVHGLTMTTGFFLNTRSLLGLSAQWEYQRRASGEGTPERIDSTSNGVFIQASKTMGTYFPYLRFRWQWTRDGRDPAARMSIPTVYLGFRKILGSGSSYWVEGQWDDKWTAENGVIDRNVNIRTGLNYVLSSNVDLYSEVFYERIGRRNVVDQINAFVGLRIGLRKDLQLRIDLRATEPLSRREVRSSNYQVTLRIDKRFSWGMAPKILGRYAGGGGAIGIGTIDGYVFEDVDDNGIMGPGEKGLAGVPLRLEDGSKATTGTDGRYRFSNVAEGPHQIRIEERSIPAQYFILSPIQVDILVQPRVTRQVSFILVSGASLSGRFIEDADQNGKIDPDDKGVADILVILTPVPTSGTAGKSADRRDLILNTYTSTEGAFSFVNILPGEYELTIDPETLPKGATVAVPLPARIRLEQGQAIEGLEFMVNPRPVIRKY